ncbi:MAG: HAMP domain-containing histidine kinase [Bacteroidales bacterium]|nr:HAMP domain-containing histidine kinase [Bacteroidales bacterium]
MKEKFLKIQFLVYAVLLYAVAAMLESFLGNFGTPSIDPGKVQEVLHSKERTIDTILAQVRKDVEEGTDFVKENSVWMYNRDMEHLKGEGFAVFVYENDTLRYWSDNSVSLHKLYSKANINNTMLCLNNGWYEVRTSTVGKTVYIGLILVKHQYKYSNKYLSNRFGPGFNLDSSLRVALMPISYGIDIQDGRGDYIFSIVPTNSYETDNGRTNVAGIFFLFALVMLMFFIKQIVSILTQKPGNAMRIVLLILLVMAVRVLLWSLKIPTNVYSLDFFDHEYFPGKSMFSTVGDFITNMVVIIFVLQYLVQLAEYLGLKEWTASCKPSVKYTVWGVILLCIFLLFGYLYYATRQLIGESTISFTLTNVMELNILGFSGIVLVSLLTAAVIYTAISLAKYFHYGSIDNLSRTVSIYLGAAIVLSLIVWGFSSLLAGVGVLYVFLMLGTAMYMHFRHADASAYKYMLMLLLSAMYSCMLIVITTEEKADRLSANMAASPSDYNDNVAELLLAGVSQKILQDGMVPELFQQFDTTSRVERLHDYLQLQYFSGYWSRYYFNVKVLKALTGNFSDINDPFVKAVSSRGSLMNTTPFYQITNSDGSISYYAPLKYSDIPGYYICLSLDRKPVPQELGYPSLLIDGKVKPSEMDGVDYVRYHEGHKISQNGDYDYDLSDNVFAKEFSGEVDDTLHYMNFDGYVHTVFHRDSSTVVVSRKQVTFSDFVVQLAYLYVFYMVLFFICLVINILATKDNRGRYSIKTRLILSITMLLLLSFVGICWGTIHMNILKFRAQNEQSMEEKVSSVYVQLEQLYGDASSFDTTWDPSQLSDMDGKIANMSHVFFTDINIYGVDGEMVACSRPDVFREGLISPRINRTAFQRFIIDRKSVFNQEENIGDMTYASAYIPFYNNNEKLVGYINLPYFTRLEELERELSTIIVSILNLYVVLMMLSIVVSVIISDRIVQPIKLIQSKIETIELGKNYEKIDYDRKDELGQLVTEYNNMVDKLDESAKLLAKGERESAWREMAKQIAHEIKNPLTPMKLSIQFLTRSWDAKNPDFESVLNKVSSTLIQQIDTLSSIATGFSNFAKLPQPDAKPLNMVEVVDNVVQLFHTVENCDITSDMGGKKEVIVMADKEQMTRVFVNIIKNATQAIPEGVRGKIHVSLEVPGDKLVVRIADNGCGIPDEIREKLFTPNFTTKSSGSGLGLAMVKNMVINAKGEITFESEVGKGTTFIITLPVGA